MEKTFVELYKGTNCLVIRFGSRRETGDLDFLVAGEEIPVYEQVRVAVFDLTLVPAQLLLVLAAKRDLVVVPPLIEGRVLYDPEGVHEDAVKATSSTYEINEIVEHHLSRSFDCRAAALSYLQEGRSCGSGALMSLAADSIAWACSYFLAAQEYSQSQNPRPLFLRDLISFVGGEKISRARELARESREVNGPALDDEIIALFREADRLIVQSSL